MTIQQGADFLNVSRPYLVHLLEKGENEFRTAGTDRLVRVEALIEHLRRDDQCRRAAADELARPTREMGL
ncbi:hypothetical protein F1721_26265 [Saccharopolyspora hirsuta]|uniref:Helix-turn-helix domain-containing protein n=1 Tax=Saccharopolyspora hirsuta TaxID=1837 RepID=A0A5M7BPG9_SACHI|nr:hypothetical protein [Saccharopolyspora hirsuta]KAA5829174.1 hypothetical protein F1721_26265 [Saccharopolyspora hirsuta]